MKDEREGAQKSSVFLYVCAFVLVWPIVQHPHFEETCADGRRSIIDDRMMSWSS